MTLVSVGQYKAILLGDSGTGKTSILRKLCEGPEAVLAEQPTVGVDVAKRVFKLSCGSAVALQLWDTAGQERFRAIGRSYYRGSHIIFLVYDVTRQDSFRSIRTWVEGITAEAPNAQCVLIGNKCDHAGGARKVAFAEGSKLASELGISFFETSALSGMNIEAAFQSAVETAWKRTKKLALDAPVAVASSSSSSSSSSTNGGVALTAGGKEENDVSSTSSCSC